MKITVKTTQGKVFQIEVEGSDTVSVLKTKIYESQGHAKEIQKIIYSGKILTDDKTIESCGIKEKDFLVLMVSKPKPTPSPAATSSSTPAPATPVPATPAVTPTPTVPEAAPLTPATAAPTTPAVQDAPDVAIPEAASGPPAAFVDTSSFLSGDALQATISNMVEMGFPRDQVMRALRASFNNPDRAVEYLMNGIPAHLEAEMAAGPAAAAAAPAAQPGQAAPAPAAATPVTVSAPSQPAQPQNLFQLAQQQQQQARGGAGATAGAGAAAGGRPPMIDVEALRNNPMMQQLREQIAQNPALIQPIIQQLASQNPAIAQMIAQDPEMLMQVLGVTMDDEDAENLPPNAHVVSVTPEERAAIERLEALGFPRQAVLEAYFACDKNEELAANYLFEGGFDN